MSGKYETYFSQMFGTHIYFLLQMSKVKIVYWLTCQWCGRGRYLVRQGSSDCAQLTCDLTIANFHLCHKLLMNITLLFHIFAFSPKYIDKPAQIIVILYLFWDAPSEGVCRKKSITLKKSLLNHWSSQKRLSALLCTHTFHSDIFFFSIRLNLCSY